MKILVAYDGSAHADIAIEDLQWAGLPAKADAVVLTALEWPAMQAIRSWGMVETDFSPEWIERIRTAEQRAAAGRELLRGYFPQWKIELEPSAGSPAESILEMADSWPADLVVAGTHGRSALGRAVMGSVSQRLIRQAHCSVRIARPRRHEGALRLLIGVDGSAQADAAVAEVARRSWPAGTEVRVLAVQEVLVPASEDPIALGRDVYDKLNEDEHFRMQYVAGEAVRTLEKAGLKASPVLVEGDPKRSLVERAREWETDAIFLGARGLNRVDTVLLGSVSASTVAHATCTVEVVRH